MPLITGSIDFQGAAVSVLVGVSRNRAAVLRRVGLPVPPAIPIRLQIDTGSYATAITAVVFQQLGVTRIYQTQVRTTFTTPGSPHLADVFDVSLTPVSGTPQGLRSSVHVLCSPDFQMTDPSQGILGRDVLDSCFFEYDGPRRSFRLAF